MSGWRGQIRDVRTIGVRAPLRAGYEVSKRLGGHSIVFGRLVDNAGPPAGVSPFGFGSVPVSVRDASLVAADRIVSGSVEVFGRSVHIGESPDWHAAIDELGSWPVAPWWRIDVRGQDRAGDVKWVWELGRHRHLVILARAAYLERGNASYLDSLDGQLRSWLAFNPPEIGIHWYSSLELSLRALAWLQILALVGDSLDEDVRSGMWRHLYHTGRHIMTDLPYTYSSMRTNHMFGDALGLIALGRGFDGDRRAKRWVALGNRMFDTQLGRHCHPDGSMIEDSVSYQRFVLEMLTMRVLLGDAPDEVFVAMEQSAQFLVRLGVLDGDVPQYGDWDEGRVFTVAELPERMQGSVRLALALAGTGAPEEWRVDHDEVAWFSGVGEPVPPEPAVTGSVGGGIGRAVRGPRSVWLKGGAGTSHGHADLSSVAIAHDGRWIVGDPGTGTYNGDPPIRTYFRTSAAHDVVRVNGRDQYGPHGTFRWERQPFGALGESIDGEDVTVLCCAHSAYTTSDGRGRIVRVVAVSRHAVAIADHIDADSPAGSLALPLHPDVSWNESSHRAILGDESFAVATPSAAVAVRGSTDPYRGWWSDTYGSMVPSTVLDCAFSDSSFVWGFGATEESVQALVASIDHSVTFDSGSVTLTATVDGRRHVRSITL